MPNAKIDMLILPNYSHPSRDSGPLTDFRDHFLFTGTKSKVTTLDLTVSYSRTPERSFPIFPMLPLMFILQQILILAPLQILRRETIRSLRRSRHLMRLFCRRFLLFSG